jgi:hypothetical protein
LFPDGGYLFVVGTDRSTWYRRVRDGQWSPWVALGGYAASGIAATQFSGGLHAYVVGPDGAVWMRTSYIPIGTWSPWQSDGGQLASNPTADFFRVFGLDVDGTPWVLTPSRP